jgi:site-specific recombinase XerD
MTLGRLIEGFLFEHLGRDRNLSPNTLESYKTSLRLLVAYCQTQRRIPVSELRLEDWTSGTILDFLHALEAERGNGARTRNQRLAALKAFFKYVSAREPTALSQVQAVMSIGQKRCVERLVGFLTLLELDAVLVAADRPGWQGRRDLAMLTTAYWTAARVSEFTGMRRSDAKLQGREGQILIHGKGRKERVVALPPKATALLRAWEATLRPEITALFPNRAGLQMTRSGAADRLKRAVGRAAEACPSLVDRAVSPHVLRHSMAMHMLESGISLAMISLFLGHESLETTNKYVKASVAMKRKLVESLPQLGPKQRRAEEGTDQLIRLLESRHLTEWTKVEFPRTVHRRSPLVPKQPQEEKRP